MTEHDFLGNEPIPVPNYLPANFAIEQIYCENYLGAIRLQSLNDGYIPATLGIVLKDINIKKGFGPLSLLSQQYRSLKGSLQLIIRWDASIGHLGELGFLKIPLGSFIPTNIVPFSSMAVTLVPLSQGNFETTVCMELAPLRLEKLLQQNLAIFAQSNLSWFFGGNKKYIDFRIYVMPNPDFSMHLPYNSLDYASFLTPHNGLVITPLKPVSNFREIHVVEMTPPTKEEELKAKLQQLKL
jgi:hypothetical protein